jgi:hypothetical protein
MEFIWKRGSIYFIIIIIIIIIYSAQCQQLMLYWIKL